jgi:NDP-sugar pyrophosphorylase family protein
VAVNAHYLASLIQKEMERAAAAFPGLELSLSLEERLLGTGGGLKKAAQDFEGPFFVANADVFTDLDLGELARLHLAANPLVSLAVKGGLANPTVAVDGDFRIVGLREPPEKAVPGEAARVFGLGVMAVSPKFRDYLPQGPSDSVAELAKALGRGALAVPFQESLWLDMGTVDNYLALNRVLAQGRLVAAPGAIVEGETVGSVVVGSGARIEPGAFVQDSVLWPGAVVEEGARVEGAAVIGRAFAGGEARPVWP